MNELTLMSFGYLYGLPEEADTVIGVRGLPNPYWVEALKQKTGLDPAVRDYVFSTPEARDFFQTTLSLLRQRIALYGAYESPLKTPLLIAVGCSGGKHRSVSMVIRLAEALEAEEISVRVVHRDLYKLLEHSAGAVVYTRQAPFCDRAAPGRSSRLPQGPHRRRRKRGGRRAAGDPGGSGPDAPADPRLSQGGVLCPAGQAEYL